MDDHSLNSKSILTFFLYLWKHGILVSELLYYPKRALPSPSHFFFQWKFWVLSETPGQLLRILWSTIYHHIPELIIHSGKFTKLSAPLYWCRKLSNVAITTLAEWIDLFRSISATCTIGLYLINSEYVAVFYIENCCIFLPGAILLCGMWTVSRQSANRWKLNNYQKFCRVLHPENCLFIMCECWENWTLLVAY